MGPVRRSGPTWRHSAHTDPGCPEGYSTEDPSGLPRRLRGVGRVTGHRRHIGIKRSSGVE
jgi:hypothetical protein